MLSLPPGGRTAKHLGGVVPGCWQLREVVVAVQNNPGRFDPVVEKYRLHLRHDRTFGPEVGVAPVLWILGTTRPKPGDADAAGEAHLAVDNEHFAVRTIVHARQGVPGRLVKLAHLDPGRLHSSEMRWVHLVAADPVEQDVHFDAGAGPFGQSIGELFADCIRPVDVALEGDALLRVANGGEHGRENSVTIQQGFKTVALQDGRSEQYTHRARKSRIGGRVKALDALLYFLLASGEVQRQDAHKQRQSNGDEKHRHGECFLHSTIDCMSAELSVQIGRAHV